MTVADGGEAGAGAEAGTDVDPWDVKGKVDYGKLIEKFGCSAISDEQVRRIERCTGKDAHAFLKRRTFFAHRDLDQILEAKEKGEPFYLYVKTHTHTHTHTPSHA